MASLVPNIIGSTNVPPITWSTAGPTAPGAPQILAGVQADYNQAFSVSFNWQGSTPQGQLAASLAAIINNANQVLVYYFNQIDPAFATGRMQDAIGRIYGLTRQAATPTTLQVSCGGLGGVNIPVGALIQDAALNLYACTGSGAIGASGVVTLTFAAVIPGTTPVPPANGVTIYQAISGWDTVSAVSGVEGISTEGRAAFAQRMADSVAGNSFGAIGSIIGAVADVPGVTDYFGYDNATSGAVVVGGVSIAANSIYVCVAGGTPQAVANAIWSKKAPGCAYTGNTTLTVYDNNPLYSSPIAYTVKYQIPTALQLLFSVSIVNGPQVPSNAAALVSQALINAVTGNTSLIPPPPRARINSTVYATSYIGAINALGAWAQVASIQIGSANTPSATITGSIAGTTLTVTAIASGTLAVNQYLSDGSNVILNGTQIVGQLTGSVGGTGTYQINQTQTVPSETVYASTPNQTLVSVKANQEPQISTTNISVGTT
jgi:hypothetical protein